MEALDTGDLLLFNSQKRHIWDSFIYWGTHSNYSHTGIVLKNPTFIHPSLRGTYVWHSSWTGIPDPQDDRLKLGVQITPIDQLLDSYRGGGHCFYRKLHCKNNFKKETLQQIHEIVYDKPYDIYPKDWIDAFFKKDANPQKTDRFWCSALIGYIYTRCGILQGDTDWSILSPGDFSLAGENLRFCEGMSLSDTETRLF
jgi:hypothetical protein